MLAKNIKKTTFYIPKLCSISFLFSSHSLVGVVNLWNNCLSCFLFLKKCLFNLPTCLNVRSIVHKLSFLYVFIQQGKVCRILRKMCQKFPILRRHSLWTAPKGVFFKFVDKKRWVGSQKMSPFVNSYVNVGGRWSKMAKIL